MFELKSRKARDSKVYSIRISNKDGERLSKAMERVKLTWPEFVKQALKDLVERIEKDETKDV